MTTDHNSAIDGEKAFNYLIDGVMGITEAAGDGLFVS